MHKGCRLLPREADNSGGGGGSVASSKGTSEQMGDKSGGFQRESGCAVDAMLNTAGPTQVRAER